MTTELSVKARNNKQKAAIASCIIGIQTRLEKIKFNVEKKQIFRHRFGCLELLCRVNK